MSEYSLNNSNINNIQIKYFISCFKHQEYIKTTAEIKQLSLPKLPKEIELDLLSVINAFDAKIDIGEFNIDC